MNRDLVAAAAALATALWAPTAAAETLRCNGRIAAEGDSRLSVVYKCGEPVMKDSFCAPVIDLRGGTFVPPAATGWGGVPCQMVEEWLYDRGPGNLLARVRILGGTVLSIRYSRAAD
ncbi:MAG: DUF2845 domain-containing protein [Burkholderiales bacterium]|nr:DUF2845 domain-containing protein [Burkholderiales bacterium]